MTNFIKELFLKMAFGNSLVVQWLGLSAFTAEGLGSIPGRGTKIPQAVRRGQKKWLCFVYCGIPVSKILPGTKQVLKKYR